MNPLETSPPAPFDLDTAQKNISTALIGFVRLSIDAESLKSNPEAGQQFFDAIRDAITSGLSACGEVRRLLDGLSSLRNRHQPRPHADPATPGALCATCSLHGALITWPCDTWTAADQILTHGQP